MSKSTAIRPRVSEKAYALSQVAGKYVFEVPTDSNKTTVAQAIEAQFDVTVTAVNIINAKGKTTRRYRKRGGWSSGNRPDVKKAYVTLKEGDSIAIFANVDDEQAEAASKTTKKETK